MVIGVAEGVEAEALQGFGSDRVVAGLADLLDPRLRPDGWQPVR
jgi:hypothetical protein